MAMKKPSAAKRMTKAAPTKAMGKKSPAKRMTKAAPTKRALKGDQGKLPMNVQKAILAAPGKMLKPAAMRMMKNK